MSEEFTLEGAADPTPGRRPMGSWMVIGGLIALATWLAFRSIQNRPLQLGTRAYGDAVEVAAARQRAFRALLPGGSLPYPFVVRGAVESGGTALVWLRADYRDDHAFLIGANAPPAVAELQALLARLGTDSLPVRQIIDEAGVQPDKRPPFAEEFRASPTRGDPVAPVRLWLGDWEQAARFADGAPDLEGGLTMTLAAGRELPFALFRQAGAHWWTVVDLPAGNSGHERLFLVHVRRTGSVPGVGATLEFVKSLLGAD
ncbi:MAG TPA: hypothetical protein VGC54_10020 [Planctomycetota bacterium]